MSCKTPALVTVQRAALWGPVLELPAGRAAYWLLGDTIITGAYSGGGGSKHEGLHPPRKLAAKATWLWGLGGKQGTEASPLNIDSMPSSREGLSTPSRQTLCLAMPTSSASNSMPKSHSGISTCCPALPRRKVETKPTAQPNLHRCSG